MLVSFTLSHSAAGIIGDCLRSAASVADRCLVVDTGITDETLSIAKDVCGDKLVVREWAWTGDYGAARNAGLDFCQELGASWALMLDTDERLVVKEGPRELPVQNDVLVLNDVVGLLARERLFRMPASGRFSGAIHEGYEGFTKPGLCPWLQTWELQKTREQVQAICQRNAEYLACAPPTARNLYYLGHSLKTLQRYPEALAAYRACAAITDQWDEQRAWATFQAAWCLSRLERHGEALTAAFEGLAVRFDFPELHWIAGVSAFQMGDARQGIRLAMSCLDTLKRPAFEHRTGFRMPVVEMKHKGEMLLEWCVSKLKGTN